MSTLEKFGLSIFVAFTVVALVNAWAFRAFPDTWGGPNIGGGALQLLAYIGVVTGAVCFLVGLVKRQRKGSPR